MSKELTELINSIGDVHGQLYLVNENIKALYQSPFQRYAPSAISALAIAGSLLVAYKTSKWSLNNQQQIEVDKRNEEKQKISQDNFKRIYSELSATIFSFIQNSILSDFHKIHFEYYKDQSFAYSHIVEEAKKQLHNQKQIISDEKMLEPYIKNVVDYSEILSKYKTQADSSHDEMMKYVTIMSNIFKEINKLAHEYDYLKNNSETYPLIIRVTDYINGFIKVNPNLFKQELEKSMKELKVDVNGFVKKRDFILDKNISLHEEVLKPILKNIQAKFKEETGVK